MNAQQALVPFAEAVLSTGHFLTIRKPLFGDLAACFKRDLSELEQITKLVSRTCKIDDVAFTTEEFGLLPTEIAFEILTVFNKAIAK